MSDPDRGYRKEGERPLSFDARQPVRGERAVPVAFLISAGILLVLIVAVVIAYRGGVRGADQAPGAIGEPVGDMKTPAQADAQPVDPAAGLQIYNDEKGAPAPAPAPATASGFAPPPEQPLPRPSAPAVAPAPAPTAVPAGAQPSGPVAARPINSPPPAAAPARTATPAPVPVPVPARAATPAPAPTPAATPARPATTATSPAASGPVSAQVGAFSSSALADRGWSDAVRLAPGAAVGKGKAVEEAQVNGRTVYRALVTGFDNRAAATAFCATISAAGGNCLVR